MEKDFKQIVKEYVIITIGLILVAISIHVFMVPNNFVTGGVSGLAIVLRNALSTIPKSYQKVSIFGLNINLSFFFSISGIMFILNTILYILGILLIGFKFGLRTVYSSYMLNLVFYLLQRFFPIAEPLIDDKLTQLIILAVMGGSGLAIVFKQHASTGGTDITGKIINKYFHIDLGKAVLISDLFIAILAFTIHGVSSFIYGTVGLFLNGIVIDFLLNKLSENKEVIIISKKPDLIRDFIINVLDKGATIYEARGAYTNEEKEIIRTIISKRDFYKLRDFIISVDKNAFITISNIQTIGLGFMNIED